MEEVPLRKQRSSSDRQVLKGAEILRQQIVENSFQDDEDIMYLYHRSSGSPSQKSMTEAHIRPFEDDDSDWSDPRPPNRNPIDSLERTEKRDIVNYISDNSDDDDDEIVAQLGTQDTHCCPTVGESSGFGGPFQNPSLVPHARETEHDNNLFGETASWSTVFPNIDCSAFEQGLWKTAAAAVIGQSRDLSGESREKKPSPTSSIMSPSSTLELLKDLQANEAELLSPVRNEVVEKPYEPPPPLPPAPPVRHVPVLPPTLSFVAPPRAIKGPDPTQHIVAPSTAAYFRLMKDEGYRHALRAGTLWQSIVAQHVRFPTTWWNGSRYPPMGVGVKQLWNFLGRHRVRSNPSLLRLVPTRTDAGRLLLHIVVRDLMTGEPILDIAIGVFHPNARGIRTTASANPQLGGCRDIWLAMRSRVPDKTPVQDLLTSMGDPEQSPLGPKRAIDNSNLRCVFGERPPLATVFAHESELYDILTQPTSQPASTLLLEKYYANW